MNQNLLFRALCFASEKHGEQKRDNGVPFVVHPLSTMGLLMHYGEREEGLLAAGVLHDIVEDCEVSFEELESRFGKRVSGLVREVSKLPSGEFPLKSRDGFVLKMCDRFSNLNDLKSCSPEKAKRYLEKSYEFTNEYAGEMALANKYLYWDLRDFILRLRMEFGLVPFDKLQEGREMKFYHG